MILSYLNQAFQYFSDVFSDVFSNPIANYRTAKTFKKEICLTNLDKFGNSVLLLTLGTSNGEANLNLAEKLVAKILTPSTINSGKVRDLILRICEFSDNKKALSRHNKAGKTALSLAIDSDMTDPKYWPIIINLMLSTYPDLLELHDVQNQLLCEILNDVHKIPFVKLQDALISLESEFRKYSLKIPLQNLPNIIDNYEKLLNSIIIGYDQQDISQEYKSTISNCFRIAIIRFVCLNEIVTKNKVSFNNDLIKKAKCFLSCINKWAEILKYDEFDETTNILVLTGIIKNSDLPPGSVVPHESNCIGDILDPLDGA